MSSIEPGQPVGPVIDLGSGSGEAVYPTPTDPTTIDNGATPIYGVKMHGSAAFLFATVIPPINPGEFSIAPELMIPLSIERRADPRESRFNHGTYQFLLLDDDTQEATRAVSQGLIGKTCTLYSGFLETDWDTADTLFTGIVTEVELDDRGYRVTARSPSILMDRTLFNVGKTTVFTGISDTDLSIDLVDASNFGDIGDIRIGSERIGYSSRTDNGGNWTLGGLTRGIYGSTPAAHLANAPVTEIFMFIANPPFVILSAILASPTSSKYGLGMLDYINAPDIAAQHAALGPSHEMRFEISDPINAKDWIEKEILRPIGAYPIENTEGLISVKIFSTSGATSGAIADADCFDRARWRGNFPMMVNHVIYLYDWDPITKLFISSWEYPDEGLIALYGDYPLVIESKGLHSDIAGTEDFMLARAAAMVARFGIQLPTMSVATLFSKRFLQIGDDIDTTFDDVLNMSASSMGFDSPTEIIATRLQFGDGEMQFELLAHPPIFVAIDDEQHLAVTASPGVTVS